MVTKQGELLSFQTARCYPAPWQPFSTRACAKKVKMGQVVHEWLEPEVCRALTQTAPKLRNSQIKTGPVLLGACSHEGES